MNQTNRKPFRSKNLKYAQQLIKMGCTNWLIPPPQRRNHPMYNYCNQNNDTSNNNDDDSNDKIQIDHNKKYQSIEVENKNNNNNKNDVEIEEISGNSSNSDIIIINNNHNNNNVKIEEIIDNSSNSDICIINNDDNDGNKVLFVHSIQGIEIRRRDLNTLYGTNWLNDEVINFYMALLQDQNNNNNCDNNYYMNTFFYTKLTENNIYTYNNVRRWTLNKKFAKKGININLIHSIFDFKKVLIPINVKNYHWVCGCINFSNQTIEYYDSMDHNQIFGNFFQNIRKYLLDEYNDKQPKNYNLKLEQWKNKYFGRKEKYPQQLNSYDCGVCVCYCIRCISYDLFPSGLKADDFRMQMMEEIKNSSIR